MSEGAESRLAATMDGAPLPDEEARALWREFSEHMEANRGDLGGFAKKKGWASVVPEYRKGKAFLTIWTKEAPPPAPAPAQGSRGPGGKGPGGKGPGGKGPGGKKRGKPVKPR